VESNIITLEYEKISSIIDKNSTVLDLGCGNGNLLFHLIKTKEIVGQGIEIDQEAIYACVEKGLTVFQSDIESGLDAYPDKSFDFAIMYNSLQQIKNVDKVINECFRISKKLIIGFPNFAQISARKSLLFGYSPVTKHLPYTWFNSPNIRFLTIKDFITFCQQKDYAISDKFFFKAKKEIHLLPNLFADTAVFVISKNRH
jgi:methionine biosynthesis protein MetW